MKPHWFKICNAVAAADEAEVLIYDAIGEGGVTANDFIAAVRATGSNRVHVRINSAGGDIAEGLAIYNFLRRLQCRVTIDGIAGSIAATIAMAGKPIIMGEGARIVIHNPWAETAGDAADLRKVADRLDARLSELAAIYTVRTGCDLATVKAMMREETWMDGPAAIRLGFADRCDTAVPCRSFAALKLDGYKHIPPAVVDIIASSKMNLEQALAKIADIEPKLTDATSKLRQVTTERDSIRTTAEQAKTELATLKAQLTAKDNELATIKTTLTAKDTELASVKSTLTAKETELAAEKTAHAETKTSVDARVDQELAKLGHKRLSAGGLQNGPNAETLESLREQAKVEKDPEKAGILAAKIRKLRETK